MKYLIDISLLFSLGLFYFNPNEKPTIDLSIIPSQGHSKISTITKGSTTTLKINNVTTASLLYHWRQVYGVKQVTIVNPNDSVTNVTGLDSAGIYQFELTVTDSHGAQGKDCCLVTVQHPLLPLEILYFRGTAKPDYNYIEWASTNEISYKGFELLSSPNGNNFKKIASIQGKGGFGTRNYYQYNDTTNAPYTFYRLKEIDLDNHFVLSDIILVKRDVKEDVRLVNPVVNNKLEFTITTPKNNQFIIVIYDMSGKKITAYNGNLIAGDNRLSYPILLNKGQYIAVVQTLTTTVTKPFILL